MQTAVADEATRGDARVWTVPNALSILRLLGLPLFLWLVLGPEADGWALAVLMASGVTDYLDGYLARRLNQTSKLGEVLDPVADRLYILAVVIGLAIRDIVPWWFAVILPLRDVLLWGLVPILRTRGYSALPVHFLGKAATFNLLYAFPLLLLGDGTSARGHAGQGLRLGVRRVGDRPVLVGRGPLRLPGLQAGEDHRTPGGRPMAEAPVTSGRAPDGERPTCRSTSPSRSSTLITQRSLDADYEHVAARDERADRTWTPTRSPRRTAGLGAARLRAAGDRRRGPDQPQRLGHRREPREPDRAGRPPS